MSPESSLLLRAKLIPPKLGPFHLRRERLHERLDVAGRGRATLILGGAGTGKTSLVASYLQEQQADHVWYRLDPTDRDPATFFQYLIEGIRQRAAGFGGRSTGLVARSDMKPADAERFADVLIRDAEETIDARLVLVLDGAEALESDPSAIRVLRRLLAYLPDTLHLVLVGRSLPDIGAQAMVADGTAAIVSASELPFDLDETRRLVLDVFGLPLSDDSVRQVHERTRGWVTALQFLRRTAGADRTAELLRYAMDRTESEIFSYFSEQVFAGETERVRDFLLRTSLPAVLDPQVIDEALELSDAAAILGRVSARHLFVSSLQGQRALYAYDPLFRGFLSEKFLRERGKAEVDRTHTAFGRAMGAKDDPSGALEHLLAAEATQALTDLLGRHGRRMLNAGRLQRVRDAATFVTERGARACVLDDVLGEACRLSGDYAAAVRHFERALESDETRDGALDRGQRAAALQGLAYSLLKLEDMDRAAEVAREGLDAAGSADPSLVARILNTLSIVSYRENRNQEAIDGWNEALARARQAGDEQLTLMIAHNLGLPYAVTGDFRRASECFRMLTAVDNRRLGPEEGAAYLNLARIATMRGEFEPAASLLDDAREIATKWKLSALTGDILEAEGNLLRETGRLEAASAKYVEARTIFTELGLSASLDSVVEEEATLTAAAGDPELADRLAFEVERRARAEGDPLRLASALLTRGALNADAGDPGVARTVLTEAVSTFESLQHAFPECVGRLWLAVACLRAGDDAAAQEAAGRALEIAARFDYRFAVRRILDAHGGLLERVRDLPVVAKLGLEAERRSPEARILQIGAERADLIVRLLGPVEVFRDGMNRIPAGAWKLRRALRVFCYLVTSRNHRATKDRLVDAIWHDATLATIKKNFHPTISFLRRALNHERHVPRNFILHEAGAYLLNPAYRYEIDIHAFEDRMREARSRSAAGDGAAACERYDAALELYRGPLLEEEDAAWIEAPRTHYEGLFVAALEEAGEAHWDAGNDARATALFRRLVEQNPLDEEASVRLMGALGDRGHVGDVEQEFHRLTRALKTSLSITPAAETRKVYEDALGRA